jgi:hypothetical protein
MKGRKRERVKEEMVEGGDGKYLDKDGSGRKRMRWSGAGRKGLDRDSAGGREGVIGAG